MKKSVLRSLSERDTVLMLETRRSNLDTLSEDELVALHSRVQRARNRHVTNYRRAGAAGVTDTGTRGAAREGNQLNRDRAEAFEDGLSRVSKRLAAVARASADQLRKERLAAAKAAKKQPQPAPAAPAEGTAGPTTAGGRRVADRRVTSPAKKKEVASRAATGARKQARKDGRGK